jgi:O-antigen ligase
MRSFPTRSRPPGPRASGLVGSRSHLPPDSRQPTPPAFDLDALRVALFLFIVISISTVHAYVGILRVLRIGLLLWVAVIVCVILMPRSVRWRNVVASWPAKAVLALAILACLSVPFGLSIGGSGDFLLSVYFRILTLFFILVAAIRTVGDLALFTWATVISAAVLALLSLTVMDVTTTFGGTRVEATSMYDANDLGLIFLVAIPMGLALFEATGKRGRWVAGLSLLVISSAVAVTGSRGAFVGMMVVVPALLVVMSHLSIMKRAAWVAVLALGLMVGAPDGYWDRISTIFDPSDDYNVTDYYGRVEVAKRGVGYMLERPLLGVGVTNFGWAEMTLSARARSSYSAEGIRPIAPHNTYVQVGAEMGVFALAIWLSLLWAGTVSLWKMRRVHKDRVESGQGGFEALFLFRCCTYFPVTFLAFASTSYFVSHAYTPVIYILVALLSGVYLLHGRSSASSVGLPARRRAANGLPSGPLKSH